MTLTDEVSKPEYVGKTHQEVFDIVKNKTESVIGKIAYGNTLHLVSMLARGLRARINACQIPALKMAWDEALQPAYLASPAYSINVALPEIRAMLDNGVVAGLCTQQEHDFIVQLATYQKPAFPDVILKDIIAIKAPELLSDGSYVDVAGVGGTILLNLSTTFPEPTNIRVEVRESHDGINFTHWRRVTHFYNVKDAGTYFTEWSGSRMRHVELRLISEVYNMSATAQAV